MEEEKIFKFNGTWEDGEVVHGVRIVSGFNVITLCDRKADTVGNGALPDGVTCEDCKAKFPQYLIEWLKNPLIKTGDGYYVHWSYRYFDDSGEPCGEFEEDKQARPPRYEWSERYQKWVLYFDSADGGGYDVRDFEYYFDTEEELLQFLKEEN